MPQQLDARKNNGGWQKTKWKKTMPTCSKDIQSPRKWVVKKQAVLYYTQEIITARQHAWEYVAAAMDYTRQREDMRAFCKALRYIRLDPDFYLW